MSRVIQFRAKREEGYKASNDWVLGCYCVYHNEVGGLPLDGSEFSCILDLNDNLISIIDGTLGQYTGIRDAKERKIFEGDIIQYSSQDGDTIGGYVVHKDNGFIVRGKDAYRRLVYLDKDTSINVIGNVYENGDLLGMKGFEDLDFKKVNTKWVDERAIMFFENGYGVSVIRADKLVRRTSDDAPFELAVLRKDGAFGVPEEIETHGYVTEEMITLKMYLLQSDL